MLLSRWNSDPRKVVRMDGILPKYHFSTSLTYKQPGSWLPFPIRGPGGCGCQRYVGQSKQNGIIVHTPACEVSPGLISVRFKGNSSTREFITCGIELLPGHADRIGGLWIGVVWDAEEASDMAQGQVACADTQIC